MLSYVMARKLAQKYVTLNLSIVLNIANSKDVIINKNIGNTAQNVSFYEKTRNC